LNTENAFKKDPIKSDANRNGKPKPKEQTKSKRDACIVLFVFIAIVRMDARTGPTQGLQPNANAMPIRKNANKRPVLLPTNFLIESLKL